MVYLLLSYYLINLNEIFRDILSLDPSIIFSFLAFVFSVISFCLFLVSFFSLRMRLEDREELISKMELQIKDLQSTASHLQDILTRIKLMMREQIRGTEE